MTCRRVRLVYSNYQLGNVENAAAVNSIDELRSSVEVGGISIPALFNGRRTTVLPAGLEVVSDPVSVNFIKGEAIAIRTYIATPGIDVSSRKIPGSISVPELDYLWINDDKVDAAGVRGGSTGADVMMLFPSAILGEPDGCAAAAAIMGSSTGSGWMDTPEPPDFAKGCLARALAIQGVGHFNMSLPGDSLEHAVQQWGRRKSLLLVASPTHVVFQLGANDITSGAPFEKVAAHLQRIWNELGALGLKVVQCTYQTVARSRDGFATLNSQQVDGNREVRSEVNQYIRSRPHPAIVGVWDVAAAVEEPDGTSRWRVDGTPFRWTADGQHISRYGHSTVAAVLPSICSFG